MAHVVPSTVCKVIDAMFPTKDWDSENEGSFELNWGHAAQTVAPLVTLTEAIPSELIVLEPREYAQFLAALASLKAIVPMWESHGSSMVLDKVQGFTRVNPITSLRRALAKCPDEYPPTKDERFSFIEDAEMRGVLGRDAGAVIRAVSNGEWKAATVLAGSVIEALFQDPRHHDRCHGSS